MGRHVLKKDCATIKFQSHKTGKATNAPKIYSASYGFTSIKVLSRNTLQLVFPFLNLEKEIRELWSEYHDE